MSDLRTKLVSGQRAEALAALRAVLADALLDVEPDDRPPIAKVFLTVLDAQEAIEVPEVSASDDLARQREARRAAAQAAASS